MAARSPTARRNWCVRAPKSSPPISVRRRCQLVKRKARTMDLLAAVFLAPFANMADNPEFVLEVVIGGLLSGIMYSLVALGFVLIFKASGVFNFAQGTMVLFAALSLARLSEFMPLFAALALSV